MINHTMPLRSTSAIKESINVLQDYQNNMTTDGTVEDLHAADASQSLIQDFYVQELT